MPDAATQSTEQSTATQTQTQDTTATASWRDSLPETYEGKDAEGKPTHIPLKGSKTLEKFKDVAGLARSYVELEQSHGRVAQQLKGSLKVPGDKATPEEITAFRKALGVPEKAEDYAIEIAEGLDRLMPKDFVDGLKPILHKHGIPLNVAKAVLPEVAEVLHARDVAARQQWRQGLETWKTEVGDATYQRDTALARRGVEHFDSEEQEAAALLDATGLGDHPVFVKMFARIGRSLAEDGHIDGRVAGLRSGNQIQQRILEIQSDPKWLAGTHDNQAALTREYQSLVAQQ
jgi:hypothetical protein